MTLEELFIVMHQCTDCDICRMPENQLDISKGRGKLQGWGKGRIMFVSQNPSVHRFSNCITPVDAGISKELVDTLISLGMPIDEIYFTNIVKCSTPSNRAPDVVEIGNCTRWISKEIELIKPLLIVGVGTVASRALISIVDRDSILLFSIYHPSFVKRSGTFDNIYARYAKQLQSVVEEARIKLAI